MSPTDDSAQIPPPDPGSRRRRRDGSSSDQPTRSGPDLSISPLESAVGSEAVRRYEAALVRLRSRDRKIVRGRVEQQRSYRELAEDLGVTTTAARAMLGRALGRLVDANGRMGPDTGNLGSLVAAVADGWPQDWGALESGAGDEGTRRALQNLRVVDRIAHFKRSLSVSDGRTGSGVARASAATQEAPPPVHELQELTSPTVIGRWGRFQLWRKLGEGAYGEVFCAYDTQLDRDVALKLLKRSASSTEVTRRLLLEARMLAKVRHPNVASVYDVGEYDGQAGLWMELVRGTTLEDLLHSRGPLSAAEATLVGQDLCRALAAVHGAGLVHRDVKTANVIREVGGRIVLTDLGAGRYQRDARRDFAGTPSYVAPEVATGSEATVLSDLYSLGVVLFRLVTGAYPERDSGPFVPFDTGLGGAQPCAAASLRDLRPDLPHAFVVAVEQALAEEPEERPQSAGTLSAALGTVLGVPTSSRRSGRG